MDLQLIAIGRLKTGPERELFARYMDRAGKLGRQFGLRSVNVTELAESRASAASQRIREEADGLVKAIDGAPYHVLDERGRSVTSADFASRLRTDIDDGTSVLAFVIGGPDGLDPKIRQGAKSAIAFGAQTWPHQLARVMLAEQIYRAATLWSGHPYHRN